MLPTYLSDLLFCIADIPAQRLIWSFTSEDLFKALTWLAFVRDGHLLLMPQDSGTLCLSTLHQHCLWLATNSRNLCF